MKKTRAVSLLLSVALLLSFVIPGKLELKVSATGTQNDSGMVIDKTAQSNGDGSYTIKLEAYATGNKIISKQQSPTDIVLVLDQSGSMKENMTAEHFETYTNKTNEQLYAFRQNGGQGNLWYQHGDGTHTAVLVTKTALGESYIPCDINSTNSFYYNNANNLYVPNSDGTYGKVTVQRKWSWSGYNYTYTFPDHSTVTSHDANSVPHFQNKEPLYTLSQNYEYDYTTTTADGQSAQTLFASTGPNTVPNEQPLYGKYSGTISRLNALKEAVTQFADRVQESAKGTDKKAGTADDINHRIAMVGFGSGGTWNNTDYKYNNTELFVGSTQYNYHNGDKAASHYKEAFQDMTTTTGTANIAASIRALTADGGTLTQYGMEMADGIMSANPVPAGEKRNRVVILFTDGAPGWSGYEAGVANAAIAQAKSLKEKGVIVYTIGIFDGADASNPGSLATKDNANAFMNLVSSNYLHAADMSTTGSLNTKLPKDSSFYLSASSADALNTVFNSFAGLIEESSGSTLGPESVIKDIIAPSFQLPANVTASNITLETYAYGANNSWTNNHDAMGATATVNGDKIDVTGFDFAANWCNIETVNGNQIYHGNKLVISFIVEPKPGFLGGNNVPTNTHAGIYENGSATTPVLVFPVPKVDVDIKPITVTVPNKDVYLLQDVPANAMKDSTTTVGNVMLDLTNPNGNYGLESWQNAYVNIAADVKDKYGNVITNNLSGLTEDSEYTVSVKVSPKETGSAKEQTGEGRGQIQVYKPQLTFKDSEAWYGDTFPTNLDANRIGTKWLHGQTEADTAKMGTAPELALSFTPDASKITDGKINTKKDVPVDVGVKIGQTDVSAHTTFLHTNCVGKVCDLPANQEFLLHINTCQLTITKNGGTDNEPYVFTIMKDGRKYSEVTIVGNGSESIYELPVGNYTISEDGNWSWRYSANINGSALLNSSNPSGKITCTNSKTNSYWLNGFSRVIKNMFGIQN